MKGKTVLKVLGVLAVVDLLDIASKGHSHAGWRSVYNDVDEKWDAAFLDQPKPIKVRAKMIQKSADMISSIYK